MEVNQPPSDIPDLPPGTFEYIDSKKKRNWKKIIEITAIFIIAAIPATLSLFKIDYSIQRVYEVINPAYIGLSPSYQNWGSVISSTKKFIKSATETINKNENFNTNPEQISHAPTPLPSPYTSLSPSPTAHSAAQTVQIEATSTPAPTKEPTSTPIPTDSPVSPTNTPVPDQEQQTTDPAILVCIGKNYNSKCSYFSNGQKLEGKCKISQDNYKMCISNN